MNRHTALVFLLAILISALSYPAAHADCQGEFTPIAGSGSPFTQVHFFPKNGNRFVIAGKLQTIPRGTGVISGGVVGTYDNASIDKVLGQKLAANTTYYVYLYILAGRMTMDFSKTGHKEDETYGNEVNATDPSRSLVGMVHTNADGKLVGSNKSQMTLSWCNRGHTGLIEMLGNHPTSSATVTEVNSTQRLEWLQWGINSSFRQGFTVPNIYVSAMVANDKVGSDVQIAIGIDGKPASFVATHHQARPGEAGFLSVPAVGANGSDEGYHYATFLIGTGGTGGNAHVNTGAIYCSPLDS